MWLSTSGNAFQKNLGHVLNILFRYNFFFNVCQDKHKSGALGLC